MDLREFEKSKKKFSSVNSPVINGQEALESLQLDEL